MIVEQDDAVLEKYFEVRAGMICVGAYAWAWARGTGHADKWAGMRNFAGTSQRAVFPRGLSCMCMEGAEWKSGDTFRVARARRRLRALCCAPDSGGSGPLRKRQPLSGRT